MTQPLTLTRARGIVIHDGKLLLMHRIKNGLEYYTLCGGKAEPDETPEDACQREIFEETGLHVEVTHEVYRYSDQHDGIQNIHVFYLCTCDGDTPRLNGEEMERSTVLNYYNPLWIDIATATTLPIKPELLQPVLQQLTGSL